MQGQAHAAEEIMSAEIIMQQAARLIEEYYKLERQGRITPLDRQTFIEEAIGWAHHQILRAQRQQATNPARPEPTAPRG